jgi:putative phosphonate transport system ATP-binding protein
MEEPAGGLDGGVRARLLGLMRGHLREMGLAATVVPHDIGRVRPLAARLKVMTDGRMVETGLTDQVIDDPRHGCARLPVASVRRA